MPCKASPIGPGISAMIADARVHLALAILSAREGGVSQLGPLRRRRGVEPRASHYGRDL